MIPREIEGIRAEIRQKVAECGAHLLEIRYRKAGPSGVITFIVDTPAGVTLEECVAVNRTLGAFFDELPSDQIQGPYLLEVNSPGLDRPLTTERDFERTAGQVLRLTRREASGSVKTQVGKTLGVKEGRVIFEVEGSGEKLELGLDQIVKAVREIRFKR